MAKTTLPHERAYESVIRLLDDCFETPQNVVIVVDRMDQIRFIMHDIQKSIETATELNGNWHRADKISLYREGATFNNGSKISIKSWDRPANFFGIHIDRVILSGRIGEFFGYLAAATSDHNPPEMECWF